MKGISVYRSRHSNILLFRTAGTGTSEKSRLFDCPLDSDEEEDKPTPKKVVHKAQPTVKSRLDAFEGDGDSLSDELDLLPPLPGAANANTSWLNRYVPPEDNGLFRLHALNCCNPRIPNKCLIM